MSGIDGSAADIIRQLTAGASGTRTLELGKFYAVADAHGNLHQIDLTGDQWRDYPRHKRGTVTVATVAAFARYYGKHCDESSDVFADLDRATVTAVLDAHNGPGHGTGDWDGARWQQHRLILRLQTTQAWTDWMSRHKKLMSQQEFAEFLEDHVSDIASDGPVTGADLLEVAQHFHASTKVAFQSGQRLASGQTQFVYQEQIDAKAGERGEIDVPSEFELGIAPYEDCGAYRIKARLRFRIQQGGGLVLGYTLDEPERRARDAVRQIVEKVAAELNVTVMQGEPAA